MGCSALPAIALRAAAGSPLRAPAGRVPPRLRPLRGSALRAARAPPPGGAVRRCAPPFSPRPAGLGGEALS